MMSIYIQGFVHSQTKKTLLVRLEGVVRPLFPLRL